MSENCWKLLPKIQNEVNMVNSEHISYIVLVFPCFISTSYSNCGKILEIIEINENMS